MKIGRGRREQTEREGREVSCLQARGCRFILGWFGLGREGRMDEEVGRRGEMEKEER